MADDLIRSNTPPEYPGLDFELLRTEGIKHIRRLAGQMWTDYHAHDPGITILDQLCYAIVDLCYRLSFEIQDLLAPPASPISYRWKGEPSIPKKAEKKHSRVCDKQFFTAREILTANPLTISDYRKLLIDINGVKNAWLEPILSSAPPIYYHPEWHELTLKSSELFERIPLNGLYKVCIEKEKDIPDSADKHLKETILHRLHQHRNLCEDFAEILILPPEEIRFQAEIEVHEGADVYEIIAQLYTRLEMFLSPTIRFYTLQEVLEQGKPADEIFDGSPLEHGFIDDEQLQQCEKKTALHTSDLITIIGEIEGIKAVKHLAISGEQSPLPVVRTLKLAADRTPRLKRIEKFQQDITVYKRHIPCWWNPELVTEKLQTLQQEQIVEPTPNPSQEGNVLTPNPSRERNEPTPEPCREGNEFPPVPSQKGKFDIPVPFGRYRHLAEYRTLQYDFPANYGIGDWGIPNTVNKKRKAQAKQLQAYLMFFDQLLANYCSQLDSVKDLFAVHNQERKTYFPRMLSEVPGASEILQLDAEELDNLAENLETAAERRNCFLDHLIARFGEVFTDYSLLLYESLTEDFVTQKQKFLQVYPQISAKRGKAFDYTNSEDIRNIENVSGLKKRISRLLGLAKEEEGFYLVEHILLRPGNTIPTARTRFLALFPEQEPDPYSFQISFVFPDWPERFQNENFRRLVHNIIALETPAHIIPYIHWFGKKEMQQFEKAYYQWRQILIDRSAGSAEEQEVTDTLAEILHLGRLPMACVLEFDGQNDYVEIPAAPIPELTGDFTLEAWIKPDVISDEQQGWMHRTVVSQYTNRQHAIRIAIDNKKLCAAVMKDGQEIGRTGKEELAAKQWQHISIVFSHTLMIYINGREVTSAEPVTLSYSTENSLKIGCRDPGYGHFDGQISEVRLWNKARSQREIQAAINRRLTGEESGLIGYWDFNDGSGITANELTGKAHHGIIRGARWVFSHELPIKRKT